MRAGREGIGPTRPATTARARSRLQLQAGAAGLASSVLLWAAFPGVGAPWLAWVAMVPLGLALNHVRGRHPFTLGLGSAVVGLMLCTWWMVPAVAEASGGGMRLAVPIQLALCLFAALPYGVAAWLTARCRWLTSIGGSLKAAVVWTAAIALHTQILPGNLAHSQHPYPVAIQVLELGGVPLLLFAIHWVNWLLVVAVVRRREYRTAAGAACIAALAVLAILGYGQARLAQMHAEVVPGRELAVGMVQPNFPIDFRDGAERRLAKPILVDLTRRAVAQGAELVVWPEIPVPLSYHEHPRDRRWLTGLARDAGRPIMLADYTGADEPGAYYNSVQLIRPGGTVATYRKRRLVPFAEFLPGEEWIPALRAIFPNALRYVAGAQAPILELDADTRLIPAICYEAAFPHLVAGGVALGGNVLVNPVNDAWFGRTPGPMTHLALALYRSVELRIPVVRVTNSGISAVILPTGEIKPGSRTELFTAGVSVQRVPLGSTTTPYVRARPFLPWAALAAAVLFTLADWRRPREGPRAGAKA